MTTVSIPGTVKDEKEIAEKAYFDALINTGNSSKIRIFFSRHRGMLMMPTFSL